VTGQLEKVVDGADDVPLGAHVFETAQQELAETVAGGEEPYIMR
jgi:hypothetical protein